MFNNHSIRSRLLLIIGVLSGLSVMLVSIGLFGIRYSNNGLQGLYNDRLIPVTELSEIKALQLNARLMVNASLAFDNPAETEKSIAIIEENLTKTTSLWDKYSATFMTEKEKKLAAKFIDDRVAYREQALLPAMALMKSNQDELLRELLVDKFRPLFFALAKDIDDLIQLQLDVSKADYENAQTTYNRILVGSIISLVIGLGAAIWFGLALIHKIISSINNVKNVAMAISNGDLNSKIVIENDDEIGVLLSSMQTMQSNLSQLVEEINNIVNLAVKGNFSTKMNLTDKKGFGKDISSSLNQLSNVVDEAFKDTIRVASALAKGDLSQKVTRDYQGMFGTTKDSVNTTVDALTKIVNEIQSMVDAAANRGEFTYKMNLQDKTGFTKEIAELLNALSNVIEKALKETLQTVDALANGDLTRIITNDYVGVFNDLKIGLNTTTNSLKDLMTEVRNTSETINAAAKEIASGNNDLSHRTEEQAASLEETAASMHELTSTVSHNSENAKQANALAVGATEIAHKGVAVVEQVVSTMENINESSLRIVDIISVIDDIAFQTNILALNAAVEAARAGEQGKGFAVVATEVRNLAQRAANAAGEIKRLIGDSVERVSGGSKQVEQAGRTMQDIVTAIQDVNKIISEIASASAEQNAGIAQVGQAIGSMDEVTQQNAALVEQVAATAETLESQTSSLARELAHFKIDNSSNRATQSNSRPMASKSVAPVKASTAITTPPAKSESTGSFSVGNDDWEEF